MKNLTGFEQMHSCRRPAAGGRRAATLAEFAIHRARRHVVAAETAIIALMALATTASGEILASSHDFSEEAWSGGDRCVACHVPHAADTSVPGVQLWNHEVTNASFMLYESGTLDARPGDPDGGSTLCLSCHDGSVAIDNFGSVTTGTQFMTGAALLGTDLTDDHPISFVYDTALSGLDGGLHDPATQASGLGGSIDSDMLFDGQVQCASCHDPHGSPGVPKLLRISNAGSALCLICHDK
jgi:predicted CXXCH cytochrome family protein